MIYRQGLGCQVGQIVLRGVGTFTMGDYVTIEDNVLIDLSSCPGASLHLGDRVKVKFGAVLRVYGGWIVIGNRTSIGEYTVILGHGGITIGDDCVTGPHCSLHASTHIMSGDLAIRFQGEHVLGCELQTGVWLGAGVRVLDGVTIGAHTAVGANSVVRHSLPAGVVAVGAPARIVKRAHVRERGIDREDAQS